MVKKFNEFIIEDGGVAAATAGTTSGMGNVSAPTISGDGHFGASYNYSGDGNPTPTGTAGSGDIVARASKISKKKSKRKNRLYGTTTPKESMYVTHFNDWSENGINENNEYVNECEYFVEKFSNIALYPTKQEFFKLVEEAKNILELK